MILNNGTLVVTESPNTVGDIRDVLSRILETYFIPNGTPEYDKIRLSQEYNTLIECVRFLQIFNPTEIESNNQKKAFWINLYNLLTIHSIVHFQIKLTVWERPNFFFSAEYNIGGYRFSLYDIVHGILRGNRRRWWFFPPPFRGFDPRIRFAINELDPRIHFALHSGSRSCPRLAVYPADRIDEDLDAAARRFINSNKFIYDKQTKILSCSKIFKWFAQDFGKTKIERLVYLAQFVDDDEIRKDIQEEASAVSVKYLPYDWHLNSSE